MQNLYHSDKHFVKENSIQYSLSIRFATDGLSFCIHDRSGQLLVFSHQTYRPESRIESFSKIYQILTTEEILNLPYQKVYLLFCAQEKTLIPASAFHKDQVAELYRLCFPVEKKEEFLARSLSHTESYLVESHPVQFLTFLKEHFPAAVMVNHAYPFIVHSLAAAVFQQEYLFVDIQNRYFDLLFLRNKKIVLFNTFSYRSIPDIVFHILNSLKRMTINKDTVQTTISGELVNDPKLFHTLNTYIPNLSVLKDTRLNRLLNDEKLNSSCFVHFLNIDVCE